MAKKTPHRLGELVALALELGRHPEIKSRWPVLAAVVEELGLNLGVLTVDVNNALHRGMVLAPDWERNAVGYLRRATEGLLPPEEMVS